MTTRKILAATAFLLALPAMARQQQPPCCRVTVAVDDAYGGPLPMAAVKISAPGFDLTTAPGKTHTLPPGLYDITAEVPGFRIFRTRVEVDQPNQVVAIGMNLGLSDKNCFIRGSVDRPAPEARFRLVGLFGNRILDVPVSPDGTFEFRNIDCGRYLLVGSAAGKCTGIAFPEVTAKGVWVRSRAKTVTREDGCPALEIHPGKSPGSPTGSE